MNTLTLQNQQSFIPKQSEMEQFISIATVLATCPFYAKMGAGGVLAIYLAARELGLPPMMCLNKGMHVIEGAVTLSAQLMNMLIVNKGHRADVLYLTAEGCKIRFVRCDRQEGKGDAFEYEFTLADAQRAGYMSKDNWKKSPRDMFYSRCLSGGARKFMPDALMNCYVLGEMPGDEKIQDNVETPSPVNDAILESPKSISEPLAVITEMQMGQLIDAIGQNDEYKARLLTHYKIPDLSKLEARRFKAALDSATRNAQKNKIMIQTEIDMSSEL
jgi:hypothetical protein